MGQTVAGREPLSLLSWLAIGRAVNLVSNPTFDTSMDFWQHEGPGRAEFMPNGGCGESGAVSLTGGRLQEFIDLDNMEHSSPENTVACDRFYCLSVKAKGEGQIRLGVRSLVMAGKFAVETVENWGDPQTLGGTWREFRLERQEKDPGCIYHDKIMVEYLGDQKVVLDGCSFLYRKKNDFQIEFEPPHAIAAPGDQVEVMVHTDRREMPLQLRLYPGHVRMGRKFTEEKVTTDKNGDIRYAIKVPAACRDGMRLSVSDPASGVKRSFFVTLTPPATIKKLRGISRTVSGKKHLLFLGDSLSDYDRGRNYIDILSGLLPDGFTVRNAGVGGDYAERVWLRLQGKETTRVEMYEQLFEPQPDIIFFFLGGNDTKAAHSNSYQIPLTPPEQQYRLFKDIIAFLRKRSRAELVIISAASSYLPYQRDIATWKASAGIVHNLFGLDRHIRKFNQISQKVAQEESLHYIDVYTPTRDHPDKRRLFVSDDGVHLDLPGHELVAAEVLRWLAQN